MLALAGKYQKNKNRKEPFPKGSNDKCGFDTAQYSRIENDKTDPSVNTLERIAKTLGITLAELFASDELKEINSLDKALIEKVALMESLSDDEKQTIYTMLNAFIGKRKLKDALSNVLQDVK